MSPAARRWLRPALLAAMVVGLLLFVVVQFTSVQRLASTLERASPEWLAISTVLYVCVFAVYALLYHYAFEAVEAPIATRDLIPVMFAAMFAKAIVPVEGAGFAAVLMADASRHGHAPARAAAVAIVGSGVDLATTFPFIVASLVVLVVRGSIAPYDVIGALIFAGVAGAFGVALWLGAVRPALLVRLLSGVGTLVNATARPFARRDVLGEGWPDRNAREFGLASAAIATHPGSIGRLAAVSTLMHVLYIAGLAAIFLTFGQRVSPDVLLVTFSMTAMFYVVAFTPQGVGVVEGGTTLVLEALGQPAPTAVAVTLVYRAVNIWVPVAIGFVAAQRLALGGAGPEDGSGSGAGR